MELNGQDKILGMPTTTAIDFNPQNIEPPTSTNSKLSSSSLHHHHVNNTLIFNNPQTLDPFYHPQTHHNHHQTNQQKPTRDPDQVSNPNSHLPPPSSANHSIKVTPSAAAIDPPASSSDSVRYRECLKNHAASTGGHVLDGCGEFMPSGEDDTPGGLKCAACECHRNFHRKEIEGSHEAQLAHAPNNYHALNHHNAKSNRISHQPHHFPATSTTLAAGLFPRGGSMMAFGGGAIESSSEDLNHINIYDQANQAGSSKKRFRTKFSQDQKERMMEVAERIGWRIQKQDEQEVQMLCADLGVKRQVFKVWMHNNKQAMKKKQL